jgi:ESS family glutamate:Na+ symporter
MNAILSFCLLCFFLIFGKMFRTFIPIFRKLYLPASVIGGFIALSFINLPFCANFEDCFLGWNKIPGFLINVVFATLFIGQKFPDLKNFKRPVAEQLCFGQIMAWGMYVVGLGLAICVLTPLFGTPPAIGTLLEIGFEGGHGTVGGMADVFTSLGWEDGAALGYTTATIGIIVGITVGMILVNHAARTGKIKNIKDFDDLSYAEQHGFYPISEQPPAGKQTVISDSIDSLAWHIAVVGIAIFIGFGLHRGLLFFSSFLPQHIQELKIVESIPLFPLCMLGGLLLQGALNFFKIGNLVDKGQMNRIGGAALDFLVVAALATIKISVVAKFWQPLALLVIVGIAWSLFGVLVLAPMIFTSNKFERAICEFGQYTGVTATGLLLLRTIDPDNETPTRTIFGGKQLLHEPIMGGGVWTAMALPLVVKLGANTVLWISLGFTVAWTLFWLLFLRRKKNA